MAGTGSFLDPNSPTQTFQQNYLDPSLVEKLAGQIGNTATKASQQYNDFISNPTASPLFTNQLAGLFANPVLQNQRKMAQQNLGDAFREAGNMSSGIYGNAAANQNTQFLQQDQNLASQLLGQVFGQMTQALQFPQSLVPSLLQALKLTQGARTGGGGGGFTFGGGGSGGFPSATQSNQEAAARWQQLQQALYPNSGGSGGASSGVNYDPSYQAGLNNSINQWNQLSSQLGSTMFMPNGDFVSGSPTSAGLYDPNASQGPWAGWTAQDWSNLFGE